MYRLALLRTIGAIAALLLLAYFSYLIWRVPHVSANFKLGAFAVIGIIGIAGAYALITLEDDEPVVAESGERTYTAAEVAELINALKVGHVAATRTPTICKFCHEDGAEVRALDGTHYHQRCFQAAYRSGRT